MGIRFIHVIRYAQRSHPLIAGHLEYFLDHRAFCLIDYRIKKLPVLLPQAPLVNHFVTERPRSPAPDAVHCHLRMRSLDTHGYFLALTAGLPITHEVHQLVNTVVQSLLAFTRTPYLDPLPASTDESNRGAGYDERTRASG